MGLICLLFPACIAMNIRRRRVQKVRELKIFEYIFQWAQWVLLINIVTMGVISYVLRIDGVIEEAFKSFPFFIKYSCLAIIWSWVLPYIVEILEKYIEVSVEIGEK